MFKLEECLEERYENSHLIRLHSKDSGTPHLVHKSSINLMMETFLHPVSFTWQFDLDSLSKIFIQKTPQNFLAFLSVTVPCCKKKIPKKSIWVGRVCYKVVQNSHSWGTYTAHWAGRGSWSHCLKLDGEPHRWVSVPGCDVWAAKGSELECWLCRWLRQTAAPLTGRTGWTPRTPQQGAGPVRRYRWPPPCHYPHRWEQWSQQTQRPSVPLWFRESAKIQGERTDRMWTFPKFKIKVAPGFCFCFEIIELMVWGETQPMCSWI